MCGDAWRCVEMTGGGGYAKTLLLRFCKWSRATTVTSPRPEAKMAWAAASVAVRVAAHAAKKAARSFLVVAPLVHILTGIADIYCLGKGGVGAANIPHRHAVCAPHRKEHPHRPRGWAHVDRHTDKTACPQSTELGAQGVAHVSSTRDHCVCLESLEIS